LIRILEGWRHWYVCVPGDVIDARLFDHFVDVTRLGEVEIVTLLVDVDAEETFEVVGSVS
jgi:hypothetical protein